MIPCKPFIIPMLCDVCEEKTEHIFAFISYDPIHHKVTFECWCMECEEDFGYEHCKKITKEVDASIWDNATPPEDDPQSS